MRVKDSIGNPLTQGHAVLWLPASKGVIAHVIQINVPVLESSRANPPTISLAVMLPLDPVPHGMELMVPGIFRTVNPEAEAALARAMGGKPS